MNADSEKEREDLGYLSILEGKPMTSGSRLQETRTQRRSCMFVGKGQQASKKCFLNHKNIPAQFINT